MKKKTIWITIIILCLIIITTLIILKLKNEEEEVIKEVEITPIEEVTEEQERQTIISLYYTNKETGELMPEARTIDAKELLDNPYKTLIELLIASPKNEKLESSIPEGTVVNSTNLLGNVIQIDLSQEFIENQEEDKINNGIYAIVNTLTELNEVNSIKILINGEENIVVDNTNIDLSNTYERMD